MRTLSLCLLGMVGTIGVGAPAILADHSCGKTGPCPESDCTVAEAMLQDDPAPGTGHAFQMFDRPAVAPGGYTAFTADTDGPADSDDVVYVGGTLIAREGDPAPGVPAGTFDVFEPFETARQVNASGQVVFIATLRDVDAGGDRALYRDAELVAVEGAAAPAMAGRLFQNFGFAGVTDDGAVGFLADLDGTTSSDSVVYYDGAPLYREGDGVPTLAGETWDGNFDEVQWNGRGDVLFEGNTSMAAGADNVLFLRRNDPELGVVEEIVAQEGQPMESHGGADFLDLILQAALAEDGGWAYRGSLGMSPSVSDAVIVTSTGFYRQEGEPVVGMPGVVLGNFNAVSVNASGDVLYLADLEGSTPPGVDEALFLNCCLVLTDGSQVPGLPDGTLFSDIGFEDVQLTEEGDIVFAAGYGGAVSGDGIFRLSCDASACPADVDGNGDVGVLDLTAVILAWGSAAPGADINGDGVVGFDDLAAVILAWGPCSG